MTLFYLILGCLLLVLSSFLLRKASFISRWLSLIAFIAAVFCFIVIYGSIAGVFISIATGILIGLLTAFLFGKKQTKR